MQFVLFRLFGYIPSPIVFGNVIDSSCLIWKNHCGQQGGFCLLYNIEQFRLRFALCFDKYGRCQSFNNFYSCNRYVGVCSAFKITAAILFFFDLLLICYREKKETKQLHMKTFTAEEVISSIISLDRLSVFGWMSPATIVEADEEQQPLGQQQDSDYNSAIEEDENSLESNLIPDVPLSKSAANRSEIHIDQASTYDRNYLGHNRSESLV